MKTLNTTDLFHTFPLGWSTNFLTWLPLHRRKQGEWGKLREETEESLRNSSIPAIRNYSSCYFQHLQTVKSMVPKCHSAGGKEILLHENLQTRHSCQNSGHGRRSKRGEGNEAKVDKKNFGNSILPMNEFFVSLQTPVKWFINNMVPDSRRSTTETRFYCTKKTQQTHHSRQKQGHQNKPKKSMRRRGNRWSRDSKEKPSKSWAFPRTLKFPNSNLPHLAPDSHHSTADNKSFYCTKTHNPPFSSEVEVKKF